MKDLLGNNVDNGDLVIIAVKEGKYAKLSRAFVKDTAMKKQFIDAEHIPMVYVEYSNIVKFWTPANRVLKITDEMSPEKRREKLNATEEAVQPS